jgi:hypothetical protein
LFDESEKDNMKVFLSWHGEMSHRVALALREWLPKVIQAVKPFISDDIGRGERWSEAVAKELSETNFGIICLTPFNLKAPWVIFEAGAISKAIDKSVVSPFLFLIDESHIEGPLAQYQLTQNKEASIFSLLTRINDKLAPETPLTPELLREEFIEWWPKLKAKLDEISACYYEETETGYPWLYKTADLERRQGQIDCKQIWLITPVLLRRLVDPVIQGIVRRNIERDVSYTFITPKTDEVEEARKVMYSIFPTKPDHFCIEPINKDEFHRLAVTDYIILNPVEDDKHPLNVFLELPIGCQDYWIRVSPEAAEDFVYRFGQLIKKGANIEPGT